MIAFSPRYDAALAFASQAHQGQVRKGTTVPYIMHVVHVSVILLRHGFDEDIVIAGLIHDVVEDCDVPLDSIQSIFGGTVARLVEAVSETKSVDGVELSWEQRKEEKLAHLRTAGPDVAALKAADAIHNLRSIIADLENVGQLLWARFKRGPEPTLWYYEEILTAVRDWLGNHPIAEELAVAVQDLRKAVSRDGG